MWYPIHAINLNLLIVKGHSDYFLKLEIYKKIMGITMLYITYPFGLVTMCYGRILGNIIGVALNTYYTNKLIGYGFFSQMKDMFHILIHSVVMGAIAFGVVCILPNLWLKLIVGILVGMAYYIAGAYLMKFEEMQELLLILKRK